jgi:hypothetical protein
MSEFTKQELETVVQDASERATEHVLEKLGIDVSEPFEFQKDMAFVRSQRESSEQVGLWVKRGVITAAISGVLSLVWVGIQQTFNK